MSLVLDFLASLGLESQLMVAATLGLGGWYLLKAVRVGKMVGGVAISGVWYVVVAVSVVAGAIALGWVGPRPGAFMNDVTDGLEAVGGIVGEWVTSRITEVAP